VAWHAPESLAVMLRRHRADDSVTKAIGRLIRADLIGIGDIGMLPVAPDAAEALFRVVDAAYLCARLGFTLLSAPSRSHRGAACAATTGGSSSPPLAGRVTPGSAQHGVGL